ncbi:unnamed protein product [Pleuronectes platessa]|uniref:Uncharacterized protein n=1 Tax=Pleuronectes platessa TaxID=8262 RepID=A0A9N7VLV3_PLEPL|nr:unnamed protein product [Pleuronectes platessa]
MDLTSGQDRAAPHEQQQHQGTGGKNQTDNGTRQWNGTDKSPRCVKSIKVEYKLRGGSERHSDHTDDCGNMFKITTIDGCVPNQGTRPSTASFKDRSCHRGATGDCPIPKGPLNVIRERQRLQKAEKILGKPIPEFIADSCLRFKRKGKRVNGRR